MRAVLYFRDRYKKRDTSVGYKKAAEKSVGSSRKAVYDVKGIEKAPESTRFVGFEDTRTADARFAAENCANIHAVGGMML
jgi:hypothetical protein